jgi:mRNA-degrading endonuclease RelE of RelBE toxin-antitoxin system
VERLKAWPKVSGVKALTGALNGYYRMRTGDYRMQFRVDKDVVMIVKVGHRDGFYEG